MGDAVKPQFIILVKRCVDLLFLFTFLSLFSAPIVSYWFDQVYPDSVVEYGWSPELRFNGVPGDFIHTYEEGLLSESPIEIRSTRAQIRLTNQDSQQNKEQLWTWLLRILLWFANLVVLYNIRMVLISFQKHEVFKMINFMRLQLIAWILLASGAFLLIKRIIMHYWAIRDLLPGTLLFRTPLSHNYFYELNPFAYFPESNRLTAGLIILVIAFLFKVAVQLQNERDKLIEEKTKLKEETRFVV